MHSLLLSVGRCVCTLCVGGVADYRSGGRGAGGRGGNGQDSLSKERGSQDGIRKLRAPNPLPGIQGVNQWMGVFSLCLSKKCL